MSEHLKDKNVFITGASSGIGKACATAFAREG
jgi:NAD(P)-dependent dehydrogenase (short-subunit alcohol dehydrogenase family)